MTRWGIRFGSRTGRIWRRWIPTEQTAPAVPLRPGNTIVFAPGSRLTRPGKPSRAPKAVSGHRKPSRAPGNSHSPPPGFCLGCRSLLRFPFLTLIITSTYEIYPYINIRTIKHAQNVPRETLTIFHRKHWTECSTWNTPGRELDHLLAEDGSPHPPHPERDSSGLTHSNHYTTPLRAIT